MLSLGCVDPAVDPDEIKTPCPVNDPQALFALETDMIELAATNWSIEGTERKYHSDFPESVFRVLIFVLAVRPTLSVRFTMTSRTRGQ